MTKDKTKLSLTSDGTTITVKFDNIDIDLEQYFHAFKILMIGATFTEDQFNRWIIDEAELISDNIKDN